MRPIAPIHPAGKLPLSIFGSDQPEYLPLPAYRVRDPQGTVVTRWQLTWRERLRVLFCGSVWLTLLTFNQPLQPVILDARCPLNEIGEPNRDV